MKTNVEPTVTVIEDIANHLERCAEKVRGRSADMQEKNDLTFAAETLNDITNCLFSLRLDLLVTRPLREMTRLLDNPPQEQEGEG